MNYPALQGRLVALWLGFSGNIHAQEGAAALPELRWRSDHSAVEVRGLSHEMIKAIGAAHWSTGKWSEVLSVKIAAPSRAPGTMPAMLGRYSIEGSNLVFSPRFPWQSGQTYVASFQSSALPLPAWIHPQLVSAEFTVPRPDANPTTIVSQIYPAVDTVPENLLKFYLHFSAPMSGGQIYQHIHLRNEAGGDIDLPFLEINEELWDHEMKRLTLFIDPGRIKREVKPLEDVGPALEEGKRFSLVIDNAWPDATGRPLKFTATKKFSVGPPDRQSPDPVQWRVHPPRAGTLEPLALTFMEPMDQALALRCLAVVDATPHRLDGQPGLALDGRHWSFLPKNPWPADSLTIVVDSSFEDLAGNTPQRPFEVELGGNASSEPNRPAPRKSTRLVFMPVK